MTNEIKNNSRSLNYVAGDKVFILGTIDRESTAELIGNLSNMVDNLSWSSEYNPSQKHITHPYNIDIEYIHNPIIDVYINSDGGKLQSTKSIMALLNLARAKGAIIRTTVTGYACSCASLIAVQGTPGFRVMYEQAFNLIHYGTSRLFVDRAGAAEEAAAQEKIERDTFNAPYLKCTNLTARELKKLQQTEHGAMFANECLKKNICDWILTTDGKFIQR